MTAEKRDQLLKAHFELKSWPDAIPALTKLKESGARLAFLSNLTPAMLNGCIKKSGLGDIFEQVLSTDAAQTYKPDARAYQLGVEALRLPREEILFVAFGGLGRGRSQILWLSYLLGQSSGASAGRTRCASRCNRIEFNGLISLHRVKRSGCTSRIFSW